jgi:hypothetical protein
MVLQLKTGKKTYSSLYMVIDLMHHPFSQAFYKQKKRTKQRSHPDLLGKPGQKREQQHPGTSGFDPWCALSF